VHDHAAADQAADLAVLLGGPLPAGTALAEPATIAIVDEISGQLLALCNSAEIRRTATCTRRDCRTGRTPCGHPPSGGGLGPPGPTTGYTPADRLATFVRARDRRCRFPGCRARATRCDLDHTTPWPHGSTSEDNLCCLCRHHHRLRHQAPGWQIHRLPDGGLQWTLPGGQQITTYPPRYGTDDADPPPPTAPTAPTDPSPTVPTEPSATAPAIFPPLTARERILGRPLPPGTIDDDPPPF
jgi:hypothetical protein